MKDYALVPGSLSYQFQDWYMGRHANADWRLEEPATLHDELQQFAQTYNISDPMIGVVWVNLQWVRSNGA